MDMETSIDTFSYYHVLTSKQKSAILKSVLRLPGFHTEKDDYWESTYSYCSNAFASDGIRLWVQRQSGKPWGLLIVVHPALVLGGADRSKLYQPKKKAEYQSIVKQVDKLLKQVNVPCSVDDMKLYRCDTTANLMSNASSKVDEYIRILKKSCLLPCYRWDKFQENEHKAKDCKAANKHSCKQYCKSASFFAYNKTAQMEMIDAFPEALIGKQVLRLEAQLRRKAMKKWAGKDAMDSGNWAIIKALGKNVQNILDWYLKRLQLGRGDYLRYRDAVEIISHIKGKKTQERMLYLLRKTSDSDTLTAALDKLGKEYGLSKNQCSAVLKKFEKLGISPITLLNTSKHDKLPAFYEHLCRKAGRFRQEDDPRA